VFGHIAFKTKDNREKTPLPLEDSQDNAIRLDCMIIYNDWPTTLECSTTFGYIKDDGDRDDRVYDTVCDRVIDRECKNRTQ